MHRETQVLSRAATSFGSGPGTAYRYRFLGCRDQALLPTRMPAYVYFCHDHVASCLLYITNRLMSPKTMTPRFITAYFRLYEVQAAAHHGRRISAAA